MACGIARTRIERIVAEEIGTSGDASVASSVPDPGFE